MPTPGGKLKGGDKLRFRNSKGEVIEAVVFERLGNDEMYSVVLERANGKDWPVGHRRMGNPKQMVLLEAHYHVFMRQGGWELVR